MLRSFCFSAAFALSLALPACRPPAPAPKVLRHTLTLPKNQQGVFLNENLVFFFSAELDRASVTSESVRITSSDGRPARGKLSVEGRTLMFSPAPVLTAELTDGGYAPNTEYHIEIRGFPAVDGLRGLDGLPFERTLHFEFKTVEQGGGNLMFVDNAPEKTRPLALFPPPASAAESRYLVSADDAAIYLDSKKPIDPTTVKEDAFRLVSLDGSKSFPLRARLIENENEAVRSRAPENVADPAAWEREPRAALIKLTPLTRLPLDPQRRTFHLRLPSSADAPRDFSGHSLLAAPLSARAIQVVDRGQETVGELRLEFVDENELSPVAVPGVDGTATCVDGRVSVRYPAAAGDGSRGDVELGASVTDTDVQATSVTLAAGQRCVLPPAPGLVVVRCQGRMVIGGALVRATSAGEKADGDGGKKSDETKITEPAFADGGLLARVDAVEPNSETLSHWIERTRAEKRNFTVLIAGGDLVIESTGSVEVNTLLLLVAGGRVRVEGSVRASTSGGVFVLGEGGGREITPSKQTASALVMDVPSGRNPLRKRLHYAVLSHPMPPRGAIEAWRRAEGQGTHQTDATRCLLRYVREIGAMPASIDAMAPAYDPSALEPAGPIQVLLELWVSPGATFDPPYVDYVDVKWEQRVTGRPH
jgi:hypothetical protein